MDHDEAHAGAGARAAFEALGGVAWSEEKIAGVEAELGRRGADEGLTPDVVLLPGAERPLPATFRFPPVLRFFLKICGDRSPPLYSFCDPATGDSNAANLPFLWASGLLHGDCTPGDRFQAALAPAFREMAEEIKELPGCWTQGMVKLANNMWMVCNGPNAGQVWENNDINGGLAPYDPSNLVTFVERRLLRRN